jgi:hypothetical protein
VFYQTTRAVQADEALLIDYGAVDWQRIPLSEMLEQEAERARHPLEEDEEEEGDDDVEDTSDDDHFVYVPMRADREMAAMLAQAGNATFVAETNAQRGIRSPFRRFSVPEMPAAFNVTLLRANEVSAATLADLAAFDLDLSYASSKAELFAPYLADEPELPYREIELEKSYYIRWSSDARGHGLFAARDLPAEYVIGQYTGVLELSQGDSLYAWAYFATPKNGTELDEDFYYHVDSRHRGNALRFVNDERGLWNTRQEQVPHKCVRFCLFRNIYFFIWLQLDPCEMCSNSKSHVSIVSLL